MEGQVSQEQKLKERILRDIEKYRQVIESSNDMLIRAAMYEKIQALESVLHN